MDNPDKKSGSRINEFNMNISIKRAQQVDDGTKSGRGGPGKPGAVPAKAGAK